MLQSMGPSLLSLWETIFAATSQIPSVFCFLLQSQLSQVQCLVLNWDFSALKTAAAFQVLLSQPAALCTCIFFLSPGLQEGIPCLDAGKLLHPETPKIAWAIVPDTSCCELIVCCTLPSNLSRLPKYPFPLFLLQLPTNVEVKLAPSSAAGAEKESCTGLGQRQGTQELYL